jgi:alkylhydroperoxidase family enzyme
LPRPYLHLIPEEEADGLLREEYDAAVERAGKVFNILKAMSLNPRVLHASMELYKEIMFGESGLSRRDRELLATVTSAEQSCHY